MQLRVWVTILKCNSFLAAAVAVAIMAGVVVILEVITATVHYVPSAAVTILTPRNATTAATPALRTSNALLHLLAIARPLIIIQLAT
jgi:hypothetical protein